MPDQKLIAATVAEVMKERKPGDTPEILLQRVKDRMAQPPVDPTPFFLQQREQAGQTIYDDPKQVPSEEPSTFMGGFWKSLKDQTLENTVGNPMLQSAAHPEQGDSKLSVLGNLLQFAIPSGVSGAVNTAAKYVPEVLKRTGQAALDLGHEFKSVIPGTVGKTTRAIGRMLGSDVTDLAHGRMTTPVNPANVGGRLVRNPPPTQTLEDELLGSVQGKMAPPSVELSPQPDITDAVTRTSGKGPAGRAVYYSSGNPGTTEQAIAARQATSPNTRFVAPNSANRGGKLVPPRPSPSLEEELLSGLESAPPPSVELPPSPGITDASTARQSGKFGKRSSRGQAGRYDSGRPGTGAWSPETAPEGDLVDELMSGGTTQPVPTSEMVKKPRTLGDALAQVEQNPRALPESLDATAWTPDDWQNARDMWGSRNVANMTGRSMDEVQRLAPKKRGQPIYVEMMKREDEARRRFDWE